MRKEPAALLKAHADKREIWLVGSADLIVKVFPTAMVRPVNVVLGAVAIPVSNSSAAPICVFSFELRVVWCWVKTVVSVRRQGPLQERLWRQNARTKCA